MKPVIYLLYQRSEEVREKEFFYLKMLVKSVTGQVCKISLNFILFRDIFITLY